MGLILVYFIYGLSFWAMGLAVLLESGRSPSARQAGSFGWLAAFGIIHGTHEWFEAYLLAAGSAVVSWPSWLEWLRLTLLVGSFGCLAAFALSSLGRASIPDAKPVSRYALPLFAAVTLVVILGAARVGTPTYWPPTLDAASRYILAVPSAVLASVALWKLSRQDQDRVLADIALNRGLAAAGFAGYALSQLFVHRLEWFPASLLSQEAFFAVAGFPIQVVRALMASVIAVGLLRALQLSERDKGAQLVAAQRARLAAVEQQGHLRRDLLRHVVRSQEDERARIARELHDEIAQLLSAFTLQLASLRTKLQHADDAEMVDRLQDLAHQMSEGLYHLIRDLRPSHLDNLGLVPAVKFLISQEYRPEVLDVNLNVGGTARPLPGLVDTALFRVVQESLTNVRRHADVHEAAVQLLYECDRVTLRIRDNGRGFDPTAPLKPPRGWGLEGMRERVEALGGRLQLRSTPSQGTTVEAVIPLEPEPVEEMLDERDHAPAGR